MFKIACLYRWPRLAIIGFALLILCSRSLAQTIDDFEDRRYTDGTHTLPYRLFVPRDYDPAQAYPIVVFLHGGGGLVGTDFLPYLVFVKPENQTVWPCFMMLPQSSGDWSGIWMQLTIEVIDALRTEFNIDPGRLYITGHSLGGFGTWYAITHYPGKFAAAVPVSGGGEVGLADRCAQTPIWNFHSDKDSIVSVQLSRDMIAAVRAAGGDPIYTEYTGYDHGPTLSAAYAEQDLPLWLFSQSH
jgi:predicted peptidase